MGRIGGSKALLVGRLRANYRYHNFVIPTGGCPYTLDFLPPWESVSSERYPRQYFEGFNNPAPAPLPSWSQLQLIPCVDILTRLNIPAFLCNSTNSANTVAQQLYVSHNDHRRQHRKATRCKGGNSQGNVRRTRVLLSCEDAVLRVGGQFTYNQLFHLLHLGCSSFPKD